MRHTFSRLASISMATLLSLSLMTGAASTSQQTGTLDNAVYLTEATSGSTIHITIPSVPGAEYAGVQANTDNLNKGFIEFSGLNPDLFYRVHLTWTDKNGTAHAHMVNIPENSETAKVSLAQDGVTQYNVRLLVKNKTNNAYIQLWRSECTVQLRNTLAAALYSTVHSDYEHNPETVKTTQKLTANKSHDDKIRAVVKYIQTNIEYDHDLAGTVDSTYATSPDRTLFKQKGICTDTAALTAAMLRSQGIPCRIIIGTYQDERHAWIQVYTQHGQWVYIDPQNGLYFDKPHYDPQDGHDIRQDYIPDIQY